GEEGEQDDAGRQREHRRRPPLGPAEPEEDCREAQRQGGRARHVEPGPPAPGSRRPAIAAPARPIGTLTRKIHSQPGPLVITPPRTQPDAPPPAAAAVQTARARDRPRPSGSPATRSASAD